VRTGIVSLDSALGDLEAPVVTAVVDGGPDDVESSEFDDLAAAVDWVRARRPQYLSIRVGRATVDATSSEDSQWRRQLPAMSAEVAAAFKRHGEVVAAHGKRAAWYMALIPDRLTVRAEEVVERLQQHPEVLWARLRTTLLDKPGFTFAFWARSAEDALGKGDDIAACALPQPIAHYREHGVGNAFCGLAAHEPTCAWFHEVSPRPQTA
jgi:hypothetical protein